MFKTGFLIEMNTNEHIPKMSAFAGSRYQYHSQCTLGMPFQLTCFKRFSRFCGFKETSRKMSLGCPAGLLALIVLSLDNLEWQPRLVSVSSSVLYKIERLQSQAHLHRYRKMPCSDTGAVQVRVRAALLKIKSTTYKLFFAIFLTTVLLSTT